MTPLIRALRYLTCESNMVLREDAPKKCRGPRRPTTGRALRSAGLLHRIPLPRSGASPKWVSKASRQFRMSLGRRLHFCLSIPARSLCKSDSLSSARLHWSLRAAAPGAIRPHGASVLANRDILGNPLRPPLTLGEHGPRRVAVRPKI